jgi:hypothetical protein
MSDSLGLWPGFEQGCMKKAPAGVPPEPSSLIRVLPGWHGGDQIVNTTATGGINQRKFLRVVEGLVLEFDHLPCTSLPAQVGRIRSL